MGRIRGHRTWSVARSEAYRACPRGFWFRYCADGEPEERQILLLKRLTTPRMEAGAIVHDLILKAMRVYHDDGEILYGLSDEGERLFRERAAGSPEICERMQETGRFPRGDVTKFVAFSSDYHGPDFGPVHDEAIVPRIRQCLDHFEQSELWTVLRGIGPERWEPLPEEGFGRTPTFISGKGVKIYAKWDFVGTDEQGVVHVVDWKTGAETEVARNKALFQLCVYVSWAVRTMGVPLRAVRVHPAFLAGSPPEWRPVEVLPEERQALAERVHTEVRRETELLKPQTNRCGQIYERWVDREDFPSTPRTRMCLECGWLTMCLDGQAACDHVRNPDRPRWDANPTSNSPSVWAS